MTHQPTRRSVVRGLAAAPALPALGPFLRMKPSRSDKLRVAVVGCWNRGRNNLEGVLGEDVVALCDVDANHLGQAQGLVEARGGPRPAGFADFRKLLDTVKLDALVVSTPDHTHAHPSLAGLRAGLPVYCEKPLAHTVEEVRLMRAAAAEAGVATQMGTQIHAGDNYRRVVELIRAGVIGDVTEVHVRCGKSWSDGRYGAAAEAPAHLDWDLWQGPIPAREYCDGLHPANWRRFWAYGTGTLGDMACHWVDLVHWALDLGVPDAVTAEGPEVHADGTPRSMHVTWEHAARKGAGGSQLAPVTVHWYDGGASPAELPALTRADGGTDEPWSDYQLFVGTKGVVMSNYGSYQLYPAERFADFTPPEPSIPKSIGHYAEWLGAIRGEGETTCSFDYSGKLTEAVLLGNVAYRCGERLTGCAEGQAGEAVAAAAPYLAVEYRKGWELS